MNSLVKNRAKQIALLWAVIVCLLLAHNAYLWLGKRIVPDTDIMALLPVQQRDPILQQSFTHMVDAAQQRVVVLIGAEQWPDAKLAADAYSAVLKTQPAIISSTAITDQMQQDWLEKFKQHSLVLMTAEQEQQLRDQPQQFWVDAALRNLYAPFSGPKLGAWRDDPFGLFSSWVQQRAQETPVRPRDGYLSVANAQRQYVLLSLTLTNSAFNLGNQQAITTLLDQAKRQSLVAVPKADIITAGVVLHAAAAGQQASGEAFTIGLGSLLGIILLMWLCFRSLKPIIFILLSITIGCLGALSVCWLLFDRIHLLTLVFGASLIGVAQDYGIFFLCQRLGAEASLTSSALLRRLLPSLTLTLLAAVIGYLGLALTPFPGLRAMAVFSALGLVFAWLTVVCWFPLFIAADSLRSGALVRRYNAALAYWPHLKITRISIVAAVLLMVFIITGLARLHSNDDIRTLQNSPKQLITDQIKLSQLLDAPTPVQFFLVRGNSQEQVLQREELVKLRLDSLIAQQKISGYQAISNWVPSTQTQLRRRALVEQKLLGSGAALSQLAQQLGEDSNWVANTNQDLLKSADGFTLDEFLSSPASEPWRHLWLGNTDGVYASIVALRGLAMVNLPLMQQAAAGLDGIQWVDKVHEISSVLGQYRQYMGWVVICAYLMVFGLLFWRYRAATWRVLAPAALASITTLAMLGWLGQQLQLFHVLAFMLLLGIGVDYGIFMQERQPGKDSQHDSAWLATGLSAANTLLSFGLLGLSNTPALQAFGLTMLIGIALVWVSVPLCRTGK